MRTDRKSRRGYRQPDLLDAARDLFFEHGYAGTTMEQIAARAGFSKRTTYIYFKNKDELFLRVAREGLSILMEGLVAIDIGELSVEEAVRAVLDMYLWFATEHMPYYRMIFQEASESMIHCIPEELRRDLERQERTCIGVVASVVEKAVAHGMAEDLDPWEIAVIFWGTAAGILQLSMGVTQTVFTDRTRKELIEKGIWTLFLGLQFETRRKSGVETSGERS